MLPLLAAAATNGDTIKKAGIVLGIVAVVGVGIWQYGKYQKKQNAIAAANKYGNGSKDGLAVQYAGLMYSALHAGWFNMTEDEKALYATAIKMHQNAVSFALVADSYRKLYQKELLSELNRLLSPNELETFNNALSGKYTKL